MNLSLVQSTQFLVFATLAGMGLIWLLITQIFDHDGGDGDHEIPAFSPRILALFATCCGSMGAALTTFGTGPLLSTAAGLGTAIPICAGWIVIVKWLHRQEANSLSTQSIVGMTAVTNQEIESGRHAEISINIQGNLTVKLARTESGRIPANTPVRIISFDGHAATVEPLTKPSP